MDGEWTEVTSKKGKGKGAAKVVRTHPTCEDIIEGYVNMECVETILNASRTTVSPYNGNALHPDRHVADSKDNRFNVLAAADRPMHGGNAGDDLKQLMLNTLLADIGKYAFATALKFVLRSEPCRIVFHVPQLIPKGAVSGEMQHGKVTRVSQAQGATLVFDIDNKTKFVFVMTTYMQNDVPDDAFDKAGDKNCFCFGPSRVETVQGLLWVEDGKGKFIAQATQGKTFTTDSQGERVVITRGKGKETKYEDGN